VLHIKISNWNYSNQKGNKYTALNLNNTIHNNMLNWINHVQRMVPGRIPEQLMDYEPSGRGPKLCWRDK
jgi:hypothetical protein